MKNNNIFTHSGSEDYPAPLLLSGKELDNIKRGGKICLISLAAGSGHKTMAATVKNLIMKRYKGIVTEDSFFDPNNSAEDHPGVLLWNRWQKSESVNWLMLMVLSQRLVDNFHHLGVRLGLPRAMKSANVTKVIDVQTNSTLSICQAVGDYNDMLTGDTSSWPIYVRFFHGLADLNIRVDNIFWRDARNYGVTKLVVTLLYIPCYLVAAVVYPLSKFFSAITPSWLTNGLVNLLSIPFYIVAMFVAAIVYPMSLLYSAVSSFFSSSDEKTLPGTYRSGPVKTVKILTDVPIYDESDRADSTVNYFNALSVLPDKEARRCNLSIISPPVVEAREGADNDEGEDFWRKFESFFNNPFPKHLQKRVHFSGVKDFLVRDAFKLSDKQLDAAILKDAEAQKYGYVVEGKKASGKKAPTLQLSRDENTLYMSLMLGGNGGVSLVRYVEELAEMTNKRAKGGNVKVHLTVFCGGSEAVFNQIHNAFESPQGREKYKNFTVQALQKVQDNIIAGVVKRSHIHITRPGGISTFELDAMRRSGTLGDTQVLFHTPKSIEDKDAGAMRPKLSGLLPWERSNALWFMANRYGVPGSALEVSKILATLHGEESELSENLWSVEGLNTKKLLLRGGLGQLLVTDGGCVSNPVIAGKVQELKNGAKGRVKAPRTWHFPNVTLRGGRDKSLKCPGVRNDSNASKQPLRRH